MASFWVKKAWIRVNSGKSFDRKKSVVSFSSTTILDRSSNAPSICLQCTENNKLFGICIKKFTEFLPGYGDNNFIRDGLTNATIFFKAPHFHSKLNTSFAFWCLRGGSSCGQNDCALTNDSRQLRRLPMGTQVRIYNQNNSTSEGSEDGGGVGGEYWNIFSSGIMQRADP